MNRDLLWVIAIVGGTVGLAYWNENYNLANPELERELVGCWAGSHDLAGLQSAASVMHVKADHTFTEIGTERSRLKNGNATIVIEGAGTWKLLRDRWILSYDTSNATFFMPRAGQSMTVRIEEVTGQEMRGRAGDLGSGPYNLTRVPMVDGACPSADQPKAV